MVRVADPKLAELWRKRVEFQLGSGLSVAEYCGREGISTASFYAWKRRLGVSRSTFGKRSRKRLPKRPSNGRSFAGGFVQVPLAINAAIEVCFADGTTARVPAEHLSATLTLLRYSRPDGSLHD